MPSPLRRVGSRVAPHGAQIFALALIVGLGCAAPRARALGRSDAGGGVKPAMLSDTGVEVAPVIRSDVDAWPEARSALAGLPPLLVAERDAAGAEAGYTLMARGAQVLFGSGGLTVTSFAPTAPRRSTGRPLGDGIWQRRAADGSGDWAWDPEPLPAPRPPIAVAFAGARPGARPIGVDRRATVVSHFQGPREEWRTGLPTYSGVVYRDLWPGIDVTWAARADSVDLTIDIAPGADPGAVEMAVRGAGSPALAEADVDTALVSRFLPGLHQGRWIATASRSGDGEIAFRLDVPNHDPARPLSVQATGFLYAGLWGMPGYDRGLGIAVDPRGAAYVTGEAVVDGTNRQAYVVKVNAAGDAVDYVAFVGGSADDAAFDIDVDAAGNAYIAGSTTSGQSSFPVTMGPDLTINGSVDALVAKIDPTGTDLVYAGYIGGVLGDFAEAIRVGADGSAHVAGITSSNAATFPVKVGPDVTFNGRAEAFVTKIVPVPDASDRLDNFAFSGFIGGNGDDCYVYFPPDRPNERFATAGHVDLDGDGNVYVSGATTSDESSFPDGDGMGDLPGPDQTHGGDWDAWVVKVHADGSGFAYAGFLGGIGEELGFGMAVDPAGAAYFTGFTTSEEDSLEPVVGPDLTFNGGPLDALAAKVAPDGRSYAFAGYLGTPNADGGVGNAVDRHGRMVIIGYSEIGTGFPVVDGPDLTHNSPEPNIGDGFVAMLKPDPRAAEPVDNYVYSGFIGGSGWDQAFWVDLDGAGAAYVAGDTRSDGASFPNGSGLGGIPSPVDEAGGESDMFVVKVGDPDAPPEATPTTVATAAPTSAATPTSTPRPPTAAPPATPSATPVIPCRCTAFLPWASSGGE